MAALVAPWMAASQNAVAPSDVLPAPAGAQLERSLDAASSHPHHVWRDAPPFDRTGLVAAYIEIPRGDRRKWEFDMRANVRRIDRMIAAEVGGYPVNYGFVPQTISYDGDPFDALVLGPAIHGGALVYGRIVGLLVMDDEKGYDAKVVLSPVDGDGRATHRLTDTDRRTIGDFFARYKKGEPDRFSTVSGWGTVADGVSHVQTMRAFFGQCRGRTDPCRVRVAATTIAPR
jgi:inorganic pyrophosphatase